jgi:hypothetical protein
LLLESEIQKSIWGEIEDRERKQAASGMQEFRLGQRDQKTSPEGHSELERPMGVFGGGWV